MSTNAVVLYRGPLGRSRLGFLLEAVTKAYGETTFIWACPKPVISSLIDHLQAFVARIPGVTGWEIIRGYTLGQFSDLDRIRQQTTGDVPIIAAGFTTLYLLSAARRRATVYCPTGVPEERLLQARTLRNTIGTATNWAVVKALPEPELTVTVSTRMSDLFQKRTGWSNFEAVPLCVDRTIFQPGLNGDRLSYLGTGAGWQGLDTLAATWRELSRAEPAAEFRVISRDERTQILVDAVGPERCDVVAADQPEDVADALKECRIGFVLRADHVVNRVAYPTKVGEYLASGTPVVTTDLDWDVGDLIRDVGCGTLVAPGADAAETVRAVQDLLARDRAELAELCDKGADTLDRGSWVARLAASLPGTRAVS